MKSWAVIVAILYALMLGVLALPVIKLAMRPEMGLEDALEMYGQWQWWLWLLVMGLAQAALLLVMGALVTGAVYSLCEFAFGNEAFDKPNNNLTDGMALGLGVAEWCVWALIFFRLSRTVEPRDLLSRQCKWLLKGSILELLIAVPTHIVARCRDYCCAGIMTFIGLTLGMSVMLFSFGPGVFFLFVARWRRLHPGKVE